MGNGLSLRVALAVAVLLTAWSDAGPRRPLAATAAPGPSRTPSPEYTAAGHALRLTTEGRACVVEHRTSGAEPGRITLDLRPPCHLLTWQRPPPAGARGAVGPSDGVPVGGVGEPMAWRYADAEGVTALAVIGDPMPDNLRASSLYRLREQQGLHCAASVQGILLQADGVQASRKRENVGVLCAELGLDELDFWTLAHP